MRTRRQRAASVIAMVVPLLSVACRGKPDKLPFDGYDPMVPVADDDADVPPQVGACRNVRAEDLRARKEVTLESGGDSTETPTVMTVTRARLWSEFKASCGQASCHGARNEASANPLARSPDRYTVTEATFNQRTDIGSGGLARILSSSSDLVMPPGSGDGTMRRPDDPIRLLGERLVAWEEAGFPDSFTVQVGQAGGAPGGSSGLPEDPYRLPAGVAANLTNIGSCLPERKFDMRMDEAKALDALFARAQSVDDLPETLVETDLVSLDSAELARRGVYSYAPTYTLFSDNASKMRYVRVPIGKTISYNAQTRDFDIPENTRFYKTFVRKVIDANGEEGYRKMETRLIVSRPDEKLPDGSYRVRSLMIVYAWDGDEMMARKVTDPLRNLEPWADRLCPYVYDEREPRSQEKNPLSPDINRATCTYMTEAELDDPASGKVRHYAIPSKERCIQCHMGSTNHSFILGFTPWHVDRRKEGEGGVFEAPHEDELDQLARLVDYGVIEGIAPGQAKLEESQGDRKPRNDYELVAQGYMMGNCAFCHNPTGFPTVENPVLKDFDLFPSAHGGAFQFPLEKYSPRAKVGPLQNLRLPYITPAPGDFTAKDGYHPVPHGKEKWLDFGIQPEDPTTGPLPFPYPSAREWDAHGRRLTLYGPWRSLIWRNVYTPFTYEEDSTIFIHMPRNVPGFDCRAQKIMGEWMLSIPSIPKLSTRELRDPESGEVVVPLKYGFVSDPDGFEQPYTEVRPGDRPYADIDVTYDPLPRVVGRDYGYQEALREAELRVGVFRNSLTGQHCPDDNDTIDALVVSSTDLKAPVDQGKLNGPRVNQAVQGTFNDHVPDHAHWVTVDTTDPPGRWVPRRSQWKEILVDRNPTIPVTPKVQAVIDELLDLHLTPERKTFSTELVPMGLWHAECRDSSEAAPSKTVMQLRQEEQANGPKDMYRWLFDRLENGRLRLRGEAELGWKVHQQSRGEAVFRAICMNCHGRDIDSRSPLAATILELSGAETRVANFRDGIFGPAAAAGQYAESEFARPGRGGTPADWQARYMVFMGMGGTESLIPDIALKLVSTSAFYGHAPGTGDTITDANMLESARSLCANVIRSNWQVMAIPNPGELAVVMTNSTSGNVFIRGTGHYELWAGLCGHANRPVVRVFDFVGTPPTTEGVPYPAFRFGSNGLRVYQAKDARGVWVYPANHPVGTMAGKVERGISPSNRLPWCVQKPTDEKNLELARAHFGRIGIEDDADMPFCPTTLFAEAFRDPRTMSRKGRRVYEVYPEPFYQNALDDWTRTGAINAGVAAYYYLDGVTKGTLKPQIAFDECKR